jgi:hypothetical protein
MLNAQSLLKFSLVFVLEKLNQSINITTNRAGGFPTPLRSDVTGLFLKFLERDLKLIILNINWTTFRPFKKPLDNLNQIEFLQYQMTYRCKLRHFLGGFSNLRSVLSKSNKRFWSETSIEFGTGRLNP